MSDYCVYRIDCAATGKAYIGLTKVGAVRRFRDHKYLAANGGAGALYAAIRKHGADAFAVSVLEDGLGCEDACAREIAPEVEIAITEIWAICPRRWTDTWLQLAGRRLSTRQGPRLSVKALSSRCADGL